jgi:capsular exopolysaccharide synthesis family protein
MSKTVSEKIVKFENRTPQSSLRDICYVLFRHKWKMILFFLAVIVTVSVSILHSPEVYRSEAKLLVRLGRESVTLDPIATTRQIINVSRSRESEVNLELEILKSRELSEKVVDSIGPDAFIRRPDKKLSIKRLGDLVNRKTTQDAPTEVQKSPGSPKVVNLTTSSDDRNKAVLKVMKNLEIKALKDSGIINISYETNTSKLAQNVITTLIDYYLEKHITVHQTPGSHQFFLEQVNGLRNTLAQSENELRNLRDKCGISSIEEQQQVILSRIAELEGQTGAAEAELAACEAKVQVLQKTLASIPEVLVTQETSGFSDHAIDLMRAKLYELQLKEHESLSEFTEGSQQVQMIRQEVAEARMLLDKEIAKAGRIEVSKGVNIAYIQIQSALTTEQAALSSFQAKVENLRKQLIIAKEGLKALNDADLKITSLKREISLQQANYQRYSENLEQARIDHALEAEKISNISVVQPATLPTRPVPQRKLLKLALGLLVGILGAIALAFFFEYVDHSIRTPDEAEEKLSLPILASIPCVRSNRIRPTGKRRKKQVEHNKTGTNSKAIQGNIFGKFKEHCIFCRNALFKQREQTKTIDKNVKSIPTLWKIPEKIRGHYSIFREELLLKVNGHSKAPFALALIGCRRGEGVSTVAANISAMLAQLSNGRVLLVDANIHYPSAHRIFETRLEPGLVDILSASQDYGDKIVWRFRNLHILTAGTLNGNPPRILLPSRFNAMINSMKKDYHYVVLDMPAVGESRSAARLASLCDGVVLVVEAGSQRWEILCKTKEQLLKYNANTLGVVLNKRKFPIPEWLYQTL